MSAAYLRTTWAAASAIPGAQVISLAGGCYGLELPVDGAALILARCPDLGYSVEYATWAAWLEGVDGEPLAPVAGDPIEVVDLGYVRPRDYATMPAEALRLIAEALR